MTPAADADYANLQRTIAELQVENERLRADQARLDWLEANGDAQYLYEEGRPNTTVPVIRLSKANFDFHDFTVRQVIDRARAQ